MSAKSEDEMRKLRHEKIDKKLEHILSKLEYRERDLRKSVENLEEKLAVRQFEEKIRAKQSAIAQLALEKEALERELKEPLEGASGLEGEVVKQTEETNALLNAVRSTKLDLEAIRKAINEPEKKRFWKFLFR